MGKGKDKNKFYVMREGVGLRDDCLSSFDNLADARKFARSFAGSSELKPGQRVLIQDIPFDDYLAGATDYFGYIDKDKDNKLHYDRDFMNGIPHFKTISSLDGPYYFDDKKSKKGGIGVMAKNSNSECNVQSGKKQRNWVASATPALNKQGQPMVNRKGEPIMNYIVYDQDHPDKVYRGAKTKDGSIKPTSRLKTNYHVTVTMNENRRDGLIAAGYNPKQYRGGDASSLKEATALANKLGRPGDSVTITRESEHYGTINFPEQRFQGKITARKDEETGAFVDQYAYTQNTGKVENGKPRSIRRYIKVKR